MNRPFSTKRRRGDNGPAGISVGRNRSLCDSPRKNMDDAEKGSSGAIGAVPGRADCDASRAGDIAEATRYWDETVIGALVVVGVFGWIFLQVTYV